MDIFPLCAPCAPCAPEGTEGAEGTCAPEGIAHFDPTLTVDLEDPRAVLAAVDAILQQRFGPGYGFPLLEQAVSDLARAFRGEYPGLLRCDTYYHDLRHALDSGLALARLLDGQAATTRRKVRRISMAGMPCWECCLPGNTTSACCDATKRRIYRVRNSRRCTRRGASNSCATI